MIEYNPYHPEVKRDPHPRFAELRRRCPVHHHVLDAARAGKISGNPGERAPLEVGLALGHLHHPGRWAAI